MTPEILLEWLQQHGCVITHEKRKFYRVKNAQGQASGVPQPREGHKNLQPMTVCRICRVLGVPIPDYAKDAAEIYTEIEKQHDPEA